MDYDSCFNCGQQGHYAANCPAGTFLAPPVYSEQARADRAEHLSRIEGITRQWHDGNISLEQKRRAIVNENIMHYEGPLTGARGHLTRMP